MVSVRKNDYDKRKERKQRTREGTPVIGLMEMSIYNIAGELEKHTFNFAIRVLIV